MITQSELKQQLSYNENTGEFTRLVSNCNFVNVGDKAGFVNASFISINVCNNIYQAHKLAWLYMTGEMPTAKMRHLNGQKKDNRFLNLSIPSVTKKPLTQESLKEALDYDESSGLFKRISLTNRSDNKNEHAGTELKNGYISISVLGKLYLAHRLAWLYITGSCPKNQIDHINTVKSDNRSANLREATFSQNLRNTNLRKSNTSGYKGVSWSLKKQKWLAKAVFEKKQIHLGEFDDPLLASNAYQSFAKTMHGEFYRPI